MLDYEDKAKDPTVCNIYASKFVTKIDFYQTNQLTENWWKGPSMV